MKFSNSRCFSLQDFFPSSKLQNTRSLTFVGRLGRSRHNTIDINLIQWHVNEWPGILKWLLSFIKRALKETFTKIFSILTDNPPKKWRFRTRCECKVWSNCDNIIWCLSHTWGICHIFFKLKCFWKWVSIHIYICYIYLYIIFLHSIFVKNLSCLVSKFKEIIRS